MTYLAGEGGTGGVLGGGGGAHGHQKITFFRAGGGDGGGGCAVAEGGIERIQLRLLVGAATDGRGWTQGRRFERSGGVVVSAGWAGWQRSV